jgi:hypothetical protein
MQTRNDNWVSDHDMWDWTGMSSGSVYGDGQMDRFGSSYTPGEYYGTGMNTEDVWVDYYVKENGNYIDSELTDIVIQIGKPIGIRPMTTGQDVHQMMKVQATLSLYWLAPGQWPWLSQHPLEKQ